MNKKEFDGFKNWNEYVNPRIEKLEKEGFFLESFFLYSATLEYALQHSISYQEEWISRLLKKSNLKLSLNKNLRSLPLGELIKIFSRYCTDEDLISQLNEFNSLRKSFVHHLLEHSIISLNSKAQKKRLLYYNLMSNISKYNLEILQKIIRSNKNKVK